MYGINNCDLDSDKPCGSLMVFKYLYLWFCTGKVYLFQIIFFCSCPIYDFFESLSKLNGSINHFLFFTEYEQYRVLYSNRLQSYKGEFLCGKPIISRWFVIQKTQTCIEMNY